MPNTSVITKLCSLNCPKGITPNPLLWKGSRFEDGVGLRAQPAWRMWSRCLRPLPLPARPPPPAALSNHGPGGLLPGCGHGHASRCLLRGHAVHSNCICPSSSSLSAIAASPLLLARSPSLELWIFCVYSPRQESDVCGGGGGGRGARCDARVDPPAPHPAALLDCSRLQLPLTARARL